ncbi:cytidylyltransferase domain-containing protein [Maridesulfovibrio sp. FT414]|uniref:acylneuraminate cytidylyltransferase family protein n=1 Tax=Maridesulfovibrio sp. FT414 TaxID=2979469 RepID=UPI003D80701B
MTSYKTTDEIWAIIPARGGSKSIPYKNLFSLKGHSLIEYQYRAAQKSGCIERIFCSTEDAKIANHCLDLGMEIHNRPVELATDEANVVDAIIHLLQEAAAKGENLPLAIALLQPTSPFLLPEHIASCVSAIKNCTTSASSQTIAELPHNYHAYNQREVGDNVVQFHFLEERKRCYNKQSKPKFYSFGNLVITKTEALLGNQGVFAAPSVPVVIPRVNAFDLDGPDDIAIAEAYIDSGTVKLNHINNTSSTEQIKSGTE